MKLKDCIQRVAYFLHITDGSGQLDLVDLSFMATVIKILIAPNIDWPSLTSLMGLILAKIHKHHLAVNHPKQQQNEQKS